MKKNGFKLKTLADKVKIDEIFNELLNSSESVINVLDTAFKSNLINKSDSYKQYIFNKDTFLESLKANDRFQQLEILYIDGGNTSARMIEKDPKVSDEEFVEFDKNRKRKTFYNELFSEKLKFFSVLNYYNYIDENTFSDYITMHKTKGSGIENVMVVMDEYFWINYNFKSIYDVDEEDLNRKLKNQKLFYVACSRTIKNLIGVKLVSDYEEEKQLLDFFKGFEIEDI